MRNGGRRARTIAEERGGQGAAYYALPPGGWRDYWTLLHPPYTVWHLSYVAIGAALAPAFDAANLGWSILAFLLAMGVAAHALDEIHDRPLGTRIPGPVLKTLAIIGLSGALVLGVFGCAKVSPWLAVFMAAGAFIVPAYCLEWFDGRFHSDVVFALAWGGFPVLVGCFAQEGRLTWAAVIAATACSLVSSVQRTLSTPVRTLRRRVASVNGELRMTDGSTRELTSASIRAAPESALKVMPWAVALLAAALVVARS
jgi:hypothetical protein